MKAKHYNYYVVELWSKFISDTAIVNCYDSEKLMKESFEFNKKMILEHRLMYAVRKVKGFKNLTKLLKKEGYKLKRSECRFNN